MKKFSIAVFAAILVAGTTVALTGCGQPPVDLSALVNNVASSNSSSSAVSETSSDTSSTDSNVSVSSSIALPSMIDGTEYYVTGTEDSIPVRESISTSSSAISNLKSGSKIILIEKASDTVYHICNEDKTITGYIDSRYLTTDKNAVTKGDKYYISEKTSLYKTSDEEGATIESLSKNDKVSIIAKTSGDTWYANHDGKFGYVESRLLSKTKIEEATTPAPSNNNTNSSNSNNNDSSSNSNTTPKPSQPSKPSNSEYVYDYPWTVKVAKGYLALRTAQAYDDSNIIGELYTGDQVYVVSYNNYSDTYWWVYSPKHNLYGYVNSNYIYG